MKDEDPLACPNSFPESCYKNIKIERTSCCLSSPSVVDEQLWPSRDKHRHSPTMSAAGQRSSHA